MDYRKLIDDNGFDALDKDRIDNKMMLSNMESLAPNVPFVFRHDKKLVICFFYTDVAMCFEVEYSRIILKSIEPNDRFEFPWKFLASTYRLNNTLSFSGNKAALLRAVCSDAERRATL